MQLGEEANIPEANVVIQMVADDFIALVHNYTQVGGLVHLKLHRLALLGLELA